MEDFELKFSLQTLIIVLILKRNLKKKELRKRKLMLYRKKSCVKVFQPRQTLNCFRSREDDRAAKIPTSLKLHNLRGDCPLCYWVLPHSHDHCWKLSRYMGCYQGQITEKYAKLVHW